MEKRKLTIEEIEDIVSVIKLNEFNCQNIESSDIEICLNDNIKNNLRKQLNNVSVYPNIIPQLKEIIVKNYYKSLIHPGEMVGTIAASSIGANTTQESLNSFHSISGDMNIIFYDNNKNICISDNIKNIFDSVEKKYNFTKVNYLGTDIDEGIFDFFSKKEKGPNRKPYTAEAVEKIIKMMNNAKNEDHLKSLKQMVDNLLLTNDDVNDAYKERIHKAYYRKADELGNYLSKNSIKNILNGVENDVEFKEDADKIKESVIDSLSWFKKLIK
jgi:hypothetical protein